MFRGIFAPPHTPPPDTLIKPNRSTSNNYVLCPGVNLQICAAPRQERWCRGVRKNTSRAPGMHTFYGVIPIGTINRTFITTRQSGKGCMIAKPWRSVNSRWFLIIVEDLIESINCAFVGPDWILTSSSTNNKLICSQQFFVFVCQDHSKNTTPPATPF